MQNNVSNPNKGTLPEPGAMSMDEIEKAMIIKTLTYYNQNISQVAKALGLSRGALYRRFEKYGIDISKNTFD
ncbi:helix-turn-helix domain-containing protein [Gelatiniphilus marinus]|uniref:Helix-turn-helix domain-containing protein n=1 Tax=Gelatiniphilus marinus TaxID=1759464 RepID=A0ABW5JP52_9FLAO